MNGQNNENAQNGGRRRFEGHMLTLLEMARDKANVVVYQGEHTITGKLLGFDDVSITIEEPETKTMKSNVRIVYKNAIDSMHRVRTPKSNTSA